MSKLILAAIETFGLKSALKIPDLGLEYRGKQTVAPMCRLVMDRHPEYADSEMHIYRDGVLSLIINNISRMSEKTFHEDEQGIRMRNYDPFPELPPPFIK